MYLNLKIILIPIAILCSSIAICEIARRFEEFHKTYKLRRKTNESNIDKIW